MPDINGLSCFSNEEQAQLYDTIEHELTVAVRDIVDTIDRMDHVQDVARSTTDKEHFTMPMDCLYELSGIVCQAIMNHSKVRPSPWVPHEGEADAK
tara:strand:- start:1665 stop:1952 length:288 start_codon:yes stop_codon:yes gene_type:complete